MLYLTAAPFVPGVIVPVRVGAKVAQGKMLSHIDQGEDGMSSTLMETDFARPDRSDSATIAREASQVQVFKQVIQVIDAMPHLVAILNENRQIVAANKNLVKLLGDNDLDNVLGTRPGESVGCRNSTEKPSGCGTTEACKQCGAVLAILSAQRGTEDEQECAILQLDGNALDLKVKASPIQLGDKNYTLFSAQNIENEKRREVLERTFFHDIINSAGGLQGIADLLKESDDAEEVGELSTMISQLSSELLDEIKAQRELLAAERWELEPEIGPFNSRHLLGEIKNLYEHHPVGENKIIHLDEGCADLEVHNARALLFRVVGNMAKNALEATVPEGSITLGCDRDGDQVRFWVNNDTIIPRDVKLQVFKRSFSTKGAGRGIGTYSMKMLTERYLKGSVTFDSEEDSGTTFMVRIPLRS
jgi:K+-sensing histidine kinase KdpD